MEQYEQIINHTVKIVTLWPYCILYSAAYENAHGIY
jgi:hypothetical protein